MEKKGWYSCQVLFSLSIVLVGILIILNSIQFSAPLIKSGNATYLDAPGLTPIVCSVLLIIASLYVAFGSWKKGGSFSYFFSPEMFQALKSKEAITLYKVFALLTLYVFGLFPYLPYWASTTLFMIIFMLTFKYFTWKTIVVSVLTSVSLMYVFGTLFCITLPK